MRERIQTVGETFPELYGGLGFFVRNPDNKQSSVSFFQLHSQKSYEAARSLELRNILFFLFL